MAPVDLAGVASVPPAPVKASVDTTSLAAPVTAAKPRAKLAPRSYKQQAVASSPAPIVIAEAAPLSPLPPPVPESIPVDDDGDSQASTIAADTPGVQHEVVVPPPRRAKSSRGLGLKHDSSTFHELATEGKHNIRRDIKNRISNFPLPIKGDADCEFNGKVDGSTEILTSDLIRFEWSYKRYHANVDRGYFVGDAPRAMIERTAKAAGVFDVFRTDVKAGMTVAEVVAVLRRYYEDVGLWGTPGWMLGYELGLSLPPDWVGDFYFNVTDTTGLDRVFEENMVTNFESIFSTSLIDTLLYGRDGTRVMSDVPLELICV